MLLLPLKAVTIAKNLMMTKYAIVAFSISNRKGIICNNAIIAPATPEAVVEGQCQKS
jgi:hypothetical protein